jgi:hypothetical protein
MTRFRITIFPAALALAAGAVVPLLAAPAAAGAGHHRVAAAVTPGQQLWVERYHGAAMPSNFPAGAVMSPDGTKVFVTGTSWGTGKGAYATVAYRASTGARQWVAHFPGRFPVTAASAIAVSPDGTMVFVTGKSNHRGTETTDYTTVAYRAATGAQAWVARYNGPANGDDMATSIAVSPRGDTVFVTGYSPGVTSEGDYATVAYQAATGTQLWAKRFNQARGSNDGATALAVSPNGRVVFVTGYSMPLNAGTVYATVAYRADTGKRQWSARYSGPGNGDDHASSVKVTPDSRTVLVTGNSYGGRAVGDDWATVAYRAATGTERWVSRYNGPASLSDVALALAVDPHGALAYVTGSSTGKSSGSDCATVAYRTGTGAQVWVKRYSGPGNSWDVSSSITTSPDGSKVFITGVVSAGNGVSNGDSNIDPNGDFLTVGYRAATGAWLWGSHYNGPASNLDRATTVVASATRVIVTGDSFRVLGNPGMADWATIGYAP